MRRRTLVLALVPLAVALGLGAWLLWPAATPAVGADGVASAAVTGAAPGEGRLAGARDARTTAPAVRGRGCTIEVEVARRGKPEAARLVLYERSRRPAYLPNSYSVLPPEGLLPIEGIHDAEPAATATADGGGRGSFEGLPPGLYDVVAVAPDGRSANAMAWLQTQGERIHVRLDVRGGSEVLRGRVMHEDGRPFRGFVGAVGEHDTGPPLGPNPSPVGTDGRFELTGLDVGVLRVVAWTPGRFAVRTLSLVLPRPGELVIVVDRGLSEREGRVLADRDGRPVAGAVVLASTESVPGLAYAEARAVTDGEGRFRLPVPDVPVDVSIRATGYVPHAGMRWFSSSAATEIRLLRPGIVRGRVLSAADGAPVAGVPVFVVPQGPGMNTAGLSGPDGRYEVPDATPTESTVFACGGGWVSKDFLTTTPGGYDPLGATPASESTIVVDLRVVPARPVRGRVLDSGGAGVSGAVVTVQPTLPGERTPPLWASGPNELAVATDADGSFAITNLPSGVTATFEAKAPNGGTGKAGPLRLEGAEPEPLVIRLHAPRFAEVTVLDGSGVPLSGVGLDVYQSEGRGGWSWLVDGHTGADGVARLGPLPPGEVEIDAWCDTFSGPDTLAGGPQGSTDPIRATLTLSRRRRVAGIVRWSDGSPAGGVRVTIVETKDESSSADTGATGQFLFEGVEATEVELHVSDDGDDEGEGKEPLVLQNVSSDRDDLEITLKGVRPPRFTLTVLDPDGRPVPFATVQLAGSDRRLENGRLELAIFDEAQWGYVRLPRTETGRPLPFGSAAFGPVPAGATTFEVRLPPELTIEGTVVDPAGRGVRGARVKAEVYALENLSSHDPYVSFASTDEAGGFRLTSLGQGKHRISVDAPSTFAPAAPVETTSGARDLRITLLEGLVRTPVVTDPNGRPVPRALVVAKAKDRPTIYAEADRDGRATLEGLESEGVYTLSVGPPFDRADLLPYRLETWTPSNDPIRLSRAFSIEGYVRDGEGRFVPGADVSATDARGTRHQERSDRLGHFVFERLPEGEATLLAEQEDSARLGRRVKCLAGARGVVLVLEAAATIRVRLVSSLPFAPDETIDLIDEETGDRTGDASLDSDGRAEFSGVHPKATYTLFWAHSPEDDGPSMVAFRTGLAVGGGEVGVKLEPELTIEGRLVGLSSPDFSEARVVARRGVLRRSSGVAKDGRFHIGELASGPWTVTATVPFANARGEVEVEAGTVLDLRVAPLR